MIITLANIKSKIIIVIKENHHPQGSIRRGVLGRIQESERKVCWGDSEGSQGDGQGAFLSWCCCPPHGNDDDDDDDDNGDNDGDNDDDNNDDDDFKGSRECASDLDPRLSSHVGSQHH